MKPKKDGTPRKEYKKKNTRAYLILKLQEACELKGRAVGGEELDRMIGFPNRNEYYKQFGSMEKALQEIGRKPYWYKCQNGINSKGEVATYQNNECHHSLSTRFSVFQRDNFACQYCGRTPQHGAILVIDHVIPRSKGGALRDINNLITSCFECNAGKRDKLLEEHEIKKKK